MTLNSIKLTINKTLTTTYNFLNHNSSIPWILLIFFSVLELILISNHTIWRDDARPILIAINNPSFLDFYTELRYESTPGLYHFFLWLLNKITPLTILKVKALFFLINLLLLVTIIFLIKLPNIYKLLLLLQAPTVGYLCYIRQYSWTILFLFLFTYLYQKNQDDKISPYLILFLLTQTCFHGCIATISLYVFIISNRYIKKKKLFKLYDLIILLGLGICALQMLQPPDIIQNLKIIKFWSFQQIYAFFLIFMNQTFLITPFGGYALCILVYLTIKDLSKTNLILKNTFLFILFFNFLSFFGIGIFRHYSFDRHHWILSYLLIILCILINNNPPYKIISLNKKHYLLFIFLFGSIIYFPYLINKYSIKQSSANEVAHYLDKYYPNNITLHEYDFMTDAISPQRKKQHYFYSLNTGKLIKYTHWDHPRCDFFEYYKEGFITIKTSTLIKDLENTPNTILEQNPIVILCAEKLINDKKIKLRTFKIKRKYKLKFLKEFSNNTLENFAIFIIKK